MARYEICVTRKDHATDIHFELFPRHGFVELTGISFYLGRAYLEATLGPNNALAASVELSGLTLLARYLRESPQRLVAFFEDLHVPRELRGHSIGTALLKQALAYMPKIGVHEIYLQASSESLDWQKRLVRLYERFGFTEVEEIRQFGPVLVRVTRTRGRSP